MKAILQKLWGNNKRSTSVKTDLREVKLSRIGEIRQSMTEHLAEIQGPLKEVTDALNVAETALDSLYNLIDFNEINGKAIELLREVEDLGIDVPEELNDLVERAGMLEGAFNTLVAEWPEVAQVKTDYLRLIKDLEN